MADMAAKTTKPLPGMPCSWFWLFFCPTKGRRNLKFSLNPLQPLSRKRIGRRVSGASGVLKIGVESRFFWIVGLNLNLLYQRGVAARWHIKVSVLTSPGPVLVKWLKPTLVKSLNNWVIILKSLTEAIWVSWWTMVVCEENRHRKRCCLSCWVYLLNLIGSRSQFWSR